MAKNVNILIATKIAGLKPGRHPDGNGLFLIVRSSGRRSWTGIVYFRGKAREMGFGSWDEVGLADAREAISAAKAMARKGIDPVAARKAMITPDDELVVVDQSRKTFREVAEAHIEARSKHWDSERTRVSWLNSVHNHCAPILDMPVDAIQVSDVVAILEPIWERFPEISRTTQDRMAVIFRRALAWNDGAAEHGNPADWEHVLSHILPPKRKLSRGHHRSLAYDEAPAWAAKLRDDRAGVGALALEFTVLTAVRSGESMLARWGEIDFQTASWSIPLSRVKARRVFQAMGLAAHVVPLSSAAVAILRLLKQQQFGSEAPSSAAFIFRSRGSHRAISNGAMERVLDRMGVEVTVHGFRSTFRNWASRERVFVTEAGRYVPAFTFEACEACLGHVAGDSAQRAYLSERCLAERSEIYRTGPTTSPGSRGSGRRERWRVWLPRGTPRLFM